MGRDFQNRHGDFCCFRRFDIVHATLRPGGCRIWDDKDQKFLT